MREEVGGGRREEAGGIGQGSRDREGRREGRFDHTSGCMQAGNFPVSAFAMMMPAEKTSLAAEHRPWNTSGARKPMEPVTSDVNRSLPNCAVDPISTNFSTVQPSSANMKLQGFTSR